MNAISEYRHAVEKVLGNITDGNKDLFLRYAGNLLAVCIYHNQDDPFATAEEAIMQGFEPEERSEVFNNVRLFARHFFREIKRDDLICKYGLRLQ